MSIKSGVAAGVVAVVAGLAGGQPTPDRAETGAVPGRQLDAPPAPASAPPGAPDRPAAVPADGAYRGPMIVVRRGVAAADASDRRVRMADGSVVSLPGAAAGGTAASPARADGSIVMPDNTSGPGEPYWRRMERMDAERRIASAEADHARASADRAERGRYTLIDRAWAVEGSGYTLFDRAGGARAYHVPGGLGGISAGRADGPRFGPFTPSVSVREDDTLGAAARRNFAEAARPRVLEPQEARDAIHRRAGEATIPPVARIQNDVDAAHRRANTEQTPK